MKAARIPPVELVASRQQPCEALEVPGSAVAQVVGFVGVEGQVRRFEVESKVKLNGNSVDLDRELTEVTKNGLEFITLMQFLQNKLKTLRYSISEGGN